VPIPNKITFVDDRAVSSDKSRLLHNAIYDAEAVSFAAAGTPMESLAQTERLVASRYSNE